MKLFRGLAARAVAPGGSAVTIGNFDGVHRGHQALLARLRSVADAAGLPVVVISFEPLPAEYFDPSGGPPRITEVAGKLEALRAAGVDRVWLLRFNARLAAMYPGEFVDRVLVAGCRARHVLVGDDFRYGRDRAGDLATLRESGERHGFSARAMDSYRLGDDRVSSTGVRRALADGDLVRAERLLGRPYSICGRVVRGEALGRRLGYPTANLRIARRPALEGIFAVEVEGAGDDLMPAVASLGTRPTVSGDGHLLEVHLFDFDRDIYGRRIRVIFRKRLRDEHRFDSLEALTDQMRRDERAARDFLSGR